MDSEMIEAQAADWFARSQGGQWSDADQERLDEWLGASTAHRVAYLRLSAAWQYSARLKALGAGVPAGVIPPRHGWIFSTPRERVSGSSSARIGEGALAGRGKGGLLAASLAATLAAVVAGAAWLAWRDGASSYRTEIGRIGTIPLSDGSRVVLNTDSRIRVEFSETGRRIVLDRGEAFFVVAKDLARPFAVEAGSEKIVALGTSFSVRRDTPDVRVVVTEGRVRLERDRGARSGGPISPPATQLEAGAVATAAETGVLVRRRQVAEVEQLLSWRTGYVTFRDTALAEAVAEFNRYSERKIVLEDPAIADIRIGGNFRTDSADAFLWLLENGFPIDAREEGGRIVLTRR
jgi:transmembrane sensor